MKRFYNIFLLFWILVCWQFSAASHDVPSSTNMEKMIIDKCTIIGIQENEELFIGVEIVFHNYQSMRTWMTNFEHTDLYSHIRIVDSFPRIQQAIKRYSPIQFLDRMILALTLSYNIIAVILCNILYGNRIRKISCIPFMIISIVSCVILINILFGDGSSQTIFSDIYQCQMNLIGSEDTIGAKGFKLKSGKTYYQFTVSMSPGRIGDIISLFSTNDQLLCDVDVFVNNYIRLNDASLNYHHMLLMLMSCDAIPLSEGAAGVKSASPLFSGYFKQPRYISMGDYVYRSPFTFFKLSKNKTLSSDMLDFRPLSKGEYKSLSYSALTVPIHMRGTSFKLIYAVLIWTTVSIILFSVLSHIYFNNILLGAGLGFLHIFTLPAVYIYLIKRNAHLHQKLPNIDKFITISAILFWIALSIYTAMVIVPILWSLLF